MDSKSYLRKTLIKLRDEISKEHRQNKNESIYHKIINSDFYKKSHNIFVFVSYGSEVDNHRIIKHSLESGKRVCVPKVINKNQGMKAVEITCWSDLSKSYRGILEPELKEDNVISEEEIDLVLVPGVAFDHKGGRLGYGGGFYDRFLLKISKKCKIVAIGYKEQIVNELPMDEHDVKINCIITD